MGTGQTAPSASTPRRGGRPSSAGLGGRPVPVTLAAGTGMRTGDTAVMSAHVRVAVVGAGFGGIAAAARLLADGVDSLVVLERADAIGGVWRDNVYPGAACDVESNLYELAAAPNGDWSRRFAPQPEIQAYLERTADTLGVTPHLRLGTTVEQAAWDADALHWRIETDREPWSADVLVAAPGGLAEPRMPDLPGLGTFEGETMHTSRWRDDVALDGKRVGVVGTGASAAQVVPAVQRVARELVLFQRTAPWVIPRRDKPIADRTRRRMAGAGWMKRAVRGALYARHEALGLAFRHPRLAAVAETALARRHLRKQVPDPALRALLTPDFRLGCKRLLLSDDYYPALAADNATVVDGALVEVRPRSGVGADGVERPLDVLIFATGFHVHDYPFGELVVGREGRTLAETWGPSPVAHVGTTVAGFPNFFLIQGPNTGLGHSSVLLTAEAQVGHVANALAAMRVRGLAAVEPTAEAQAAWAAEVDRMGEGTVWTAGGCESWYLDETGRNAAIWPGSVPAFRRRVAPFHPADYTLTPAHAVPA